MRVVIEKPPEGGEEELIVRVNQLSERVLELLRVIQAEDEKLMCYHEDGSLSVLCPSSVFYFESVDNRVYAYEKAEVSELKQKLYELEQRFAGGDPAKRGESRDFPSVCSRCEKAAGVVRCGDEE